MSSLRYWGTGFVVFMLWLAAYMAIVPFSQWLTYSAFALGKHTPLADAVEFFLYDAAKIFLLLILLVYVMAWLRATLNVERVRDYMAGKGRAVGYLAGALFGAITPFCSCSGIPLFLGFARAQIPLGIIMAFLITSPLINEVAFILLWGLLGWQFTIVYVSVGLIVGIVGGFIMDFFKAERYLQPFLRAQHMQAHIGSPTPSPGGGLMELTPKHRPAMPLEKRHAFAMNEVRSVVSCTWKWLLLGIAIGAWLHGYVPQDWFETHLGAGQWWSVPMAVLLGLPLYTSCTGVIPIMESLLLKGLPVGTTLAFSMSAVAVSLPEMIMLKQVMQGRLLAAFIVMMLVLFTLVGWFFNATQGYIF